MAARPTLETVARAAGVSRQTVSNVLNTPDRVRSSTRSRVQRAIEDLGYQPSLAARQLRTSRSRTLGMRLEPSHDGINGVVFDRFLHALVEIAQGTGYRVLLYTAADDGDELTTYQSLLSTGQVDGFVLTSTHHGDPRTAWLNEHDVPFSTFGRPWGAVEAPHAWVDVDGAAGTAQAVEHLTAAGHRRVAFIGWPAGSGVGDDRREGWRRGLAEAGIGPDPALDTAVDDGVGAGTREAERLLGEPDPPTGFVCASDSLALGVLGALNRHRRNAPTGGSPPPAVVGFDDTPVAAAVGLTSVAQPLASAARACLEQVLADLAGANSGQAHAAAATPPRERTPVLLTPTLVVRASSP
jgi:DNA-binding LacI/PurR family transcriptional regulator